MMTISRLENCAALAMVETGNSVALTTTSNLPIPSVMDANGTLTKACGLSAVCTTMMISRQKEIAAPAVEENGCEYDRSVLKASSKYDK